jgi:hypothetical protein
MDNVQNCDSYRSYLLSAFILVLQRQRQLISFTLTSYKLLTRFRSVSIYDVDITSTLPFPFYISRRDLLSWTSLYKSILHKQEVLGHSIKLSTDYKFHKLVSNDRQIHKVTAPYPTRWWHSYLSLSEPQILHGIKLKIIIHKEQYLLYPNISVYIFIFADKQCISTKHQKTVKFT